MTKCPNCGAHSQRQFCNLCNRLFLDGSEEIWVATLGKRAIAQLIDLAIIVVTAGVGWLVWLYFTAPWGQSPGKKLVGIQCLRSDGSSAPPLILWIREVGKVLLWGLASAGFFYIPVIPAYGWAIWSDKRRTWHDFLFRTMVVTELESTRRRRLLVRETRSLAREQKKREKASRRLEREDRRKRQKAESEREAADRRAQRDGELAERHEREEAERAARVEVEQAGQKLVRELAEHMLDPSYDLRSSVEAFVKSHPGTTGLLASLLVRQIAVTVTGSERRYSGKLRLKEGILVESGISHHLVPIEEIRQVSRFASGFFEGVEIDAAPGHYRANASSREADAFERDLRSIVNKAHAVLARAGFEDLGSWTVHFISLPTELISSLPSMARESIKAMTMEEQHQFLEEYQRRKKSLGFAFFLWLLLGWHYAYLGKWGVMVLFWLTLGGLLLWWLIDFFRLSSLVENYNKDIALDILRTQRLIAPPSS